MSHSPEDKAKYDRARLKARMMGNVAGAVLKIVSENSDDLVWPDEEGEQAMHNLNVLKVSSEIANRYVEMLLKKSGL